MPIVVTTIRRQAVRASTWKPIWTTKSPAGIQVQRVTFRPCSPKGSAWVRAGTTTAIAMIQTATTVASGTISAAVRPKRSISRRPNRAVKAKPRMGSSGISGIRIP